MKSEKQQRQLYLDSFPLASPEIIPLVSLRCFLGSLFLGIYVHVRKKIFCLMLWYDDGSHTTARVGHPSTARHFRRSSLLFTMHRTPQNQRAGGY